MTTRLNRYYNNPNIGAAASNLASLFAPPSPQDMLAYSTVQQQQAEEKRIADFLGMGAGADPLQLDIHGAAAGLYSPNQGFHAVNLGDATDRRGQDLSYSATTRGQDVNRATALDTNRLDNQTRLVGDMFGPLNQGQVRPAVPENVMGIFDMPGLDAELGLDKPMSVDETVAANMDPETARILGLSDIPIETILDENGGAPTIVPRGMAWGQEPHIQAGTPAAPVFRNYRTADGRTGIAVTDPTENIMVDQNTKEILPPGTTFGEIQDTSEGFTRAFESQVQMRGNALLGGFATLDRIRQVSASSPGSLGILGGLRGTAQNVIQTGGELAQIFGGTIAEVNEGLASGLVESGVAEEMFDPNLPALDMLMNILSWQLAKSFAGDRVSNEQLRVAQGMIGQNKTWGNQADVEARLSELDSMFSREASQIIDALPPQQQAQLRGRIGAVMQPPAAVPNGAPAPAAPAAPPTGNAGGVQWRLLD